MKNSGLQNSPLVSVLLAVYNGDRYIGKLIKTILSQSYTNFEFIISDNSSTDNTESICRKFSVEDKRIKYFRQIRNLGAFDNFSWVAKEAKGKYCVWIGDDDEYELNFLSEYVNRILSDDDIVLVYSDYEWISESSEISESGLKLIHSAKDSRFISILKFIYNPAPLPLMMGLFKTNILKLALPIPEWPYPYQNFGGCRDIGFLWRVIPNGKVSGIRKKLFKYRSRDRWASIGGEWGNSWLRYWLDLIKINLMQLRSQAIPAILNANITNLEKFVLIIFAIIVFVFKFSVYQPVSKFKMLVK